MIEINTPDLYEGSNLLLNTTLVSYLNACADYDVIAIGLVITNLNDYFNELRQPLHLDEIIITNAFRTIREQGLVEGYLRPSPLHQETGSSLAIVLDEINPEGLVPKDDTAYIHFRKIIEEEEARRTPKKTFSKLQLLKALLGELINEDVPKPLRQKAQALKDELGD